MIVNRAFRYRAEPEPEQKEKFLRFAGARRFIFNRGLELRTITFQNEGKTISYFEQNNELTRLKKLPETAWLKEIHSQVLQQGLKDLDRGFQNFFRRVKKGEKPGYPKFKKRGVRDSFRYPQGVKIEDDKVFLPRIGWVKFRKTRDIQGTIKETTIIQEGEHWYICFSCEWEIPTPLQAPIDEKRAVGIDVGIHRFATLAHGTTNDRIEIKNPKFLKKLLPRLRYLSRRLSKKTKKSKNRLKARIKLSKLHARIRNLRKDFVQQLSAEMIKNHDIFCIENLDISHLLQESPKGLARAIADAGWRSFLHCLKYKAQERGKHIVEVGRYFASSQSCSHCRQLQKMPLSIREYDCPNCGLKIDRDYNSAIVLKAAGMSVLQACGAAS
jgi:putative transposase